MCNNHTALIAAAPDLLQAARCALADLEDILPEFESSGNREHPAWQTIEELRAAIRKATACGHPDDRDCLRPVILAGLK